MPNSKATATAVGSFRDLKLSEPLLAALDDVGYEPWAIGTGETATGSGR